MRILAALLVWFAFDAALFRTGIYTHWLAPDSYAGQFESTLAFGRAVQQSAGANLVATFGNSRFSYLPRVANELTPETGLVFHGASVPGSEVRSYYYTLRDLDPSANRYRALVFGVDDYDDEEQYYHPADDPRMLHMCAARLRLSDIPDVVISFRTGPDRAFALRGLLFRGFLLQDDVRDFLRDPKGRIEAVRQWRLHGHEWQYDYDGDPDNLAGLTVDWKQMKLNFPPGTTELQRAAATNWLLRQNPPQTGALAPFNRRWFGAIIDRYRHSSTRIIFVRLPRGPVVRPDWLVQKKTASIREFAGRPNVTLYDEHAFDSLERPEFFRDGVHLNREGAHLFSHTLARAVHEVLETRP